MRDSTSSLKKRRDYTLNRGSLRTRDSDIFEHNGATMRVTAVIRIRTNSNNLLQHRVEVSGYGYLFYRILDLATLNPKSSGPA